MVGTSPAGSLAPSSPPASAGVGVPAVSVGTFDSGTGEQSTSIFVSNGACTNGPLTGSESVRNTDAQQDFNNNGTSVQGMWEDASDHTDSASNTWNLCGCNDAGTGNWTASYAVLKLTEWQN